MVQLPRSKTASGKPHVKVFSVSTYGTWEATRAAAEQDVMKATGTPQTRDEEEVKPVPKEKRPKNPKRKEAALVREDAKRKKRCQDMNERAVVAAGNWKKHLANAPTEREGDGEGIWWKKGAPPCANITVPVIKQRRWTAPHPFALDYEKVRREQMRTWGWWTPADEARWQWYAYGKDERSPAGAKPETGQEDPCSKSITNDKGTSALPDPSAPTTNGPRRSSGDDEDGPDGGDEEEPGEIIAFLQQHMEQERHALEEELDRELAARHEEDQDENPQEEGTSPILWKLPEAWWAGKPVLSPSPVGNPWCRPPLGTRRPTRAQMQERRTIGAAFVRSHDDEGRVLGARGKEEEAEAADGAPERAEASAEPDGGDAHAPTSTPVATPPRGAAAAWANKWRNFCLMMEGRLVSEGRTEAAAAFEAAKESPFPSTVSRPKGRSQGTRRGAWTIVEGEEHGHEGVWALDEAEGEVLRRHFFPYRRDLPGDPFSGARAEAEILIWEDIQQAQKERETLVDTGTVGAHDENGRDYALEVKEVKKHMHIAFYRRGGAGGRQTGKHERGAQDEEARQLPCGGTGSSASNTLVLVCEDPVEPSPMKKPRRILPSCAGEVSVQSTQEEDRLIQEVSTEVGGPRGNLPNDQQETPGGAAGPLGGHPSTH